MSRRTPALLLIALAGWTTATSTASAQFFRDLVREQRDLGRLNNDERRLQQDLSNGNLLGTINDLSNINHDEMRIQRDEARLQYDLYDRPVYPSYPGYQPNYVTQIQNQGLVPHPLYPGYYYYPSDPGQLYTIPGQLAPAQTSVATYTPPTTNSTPVASNPTPPARRVSVSLINPEDYGVNLRFSADGKSYNLPSGYTQNLDITSSSVIIFDRGSQFGNARYTVSNGTYQFKFTEHGWDLYKKPASNPVPNASFASNPVPTNPAPTGSTSGLVPTRFTAPAPPSAPAPPPGS